MTKANTSDFFDGLSDMFEKVAGVVEDILTPDIEEEDDDELVSYRYVETLGLSDELVLNDGTWKVTAIQSDGFDKDIISVSLSNGESYDLLANSLVQVVGE